VSAFSPNGQERNVTEHRQTVEERSYLPPMGRRWLLPLYDPLTRLAGVSRLHEGLVDRASIQPGHRVLEIGCGTGNLLITVARRHPGAEVIGIDPDPAALRRARRKANRARLPVRLERAFAGELPFRDGSIDRVLSSLMLHHLDDDEKPRAMHEIRRVLRPGGQLHLVDFAATPPKRGPIDHLIHRSPRLAGTLADRVLATMSEAGLTDVADNGHGHSRLGGYTYYRATR
jgi:ubiquinone/menaquinone biosynthesis C-methylase UbiE